MSRRTIDFDPGAWLGDAGLRLCSIPARGLWIEMLCLMHKGERYGYLQLGGKPIDAGQLSKIVGASDALVFDWMAELEANHVFSRDDKGVIYSRRMAREYVPAVAEEKRALNDEKPAATSNGVPIPPTPVERLVAAYHEQLPDLPRVAKVLGQRRDMVRARWRDAWEDAARKGRKWNGVDDGVAYFAKLFGWINANCPFLLGKGQPDRESGKVFVADFEWIMRPANFVKIIEGKYSGGANG